jgi:histidinol-phosphate aminotransferase
MNSFDSSTYFPSHILQLEAYKSGKPIKELAREKRLTDIIKLASNENPHGPSPSLEKYFQSDLFRKENLLSQYPDMNAFSLKEQLVHYYSRLEPTQTWSPQNFCIANGSEEVLSAIVRSVCHAKDEIIIPQFSFIGMEIIAKMNNLCIRSPHFFSLIDELDYQDSENLALILREFKNCITSKTKLIYLANPNNPTGTYLPIHIIQSLLEHTPEITLFIIDEAYIEYAIFELGTFSCVRELQKYPNLIVLRTFSKAYGLAGLRVGYGIAHPSIIEQIAKVKLPFGPSQIAQDCAQLALLDQEHLKMSLQVNYSEKTKLIHFFQSFDFHSLSSATNFLTFVFSNQEKVCHMCDQFLDQGIILRNLITNKMPNALRISIGKVKENQKFMETFPDIFSSLKYI